MEWPKLKNIVLAILAVTNLFLLVFVVQQELRDSGLRRQTREDAIQFLEQRGVSVDRGEIPEEMALLPQLVERDLAGEEALAARLLGEGLRVKPLGGEVYRYFNEKGSVQFHSDGAFQADFTVGAFPLGSDRTQTCLDLLARLDFTGELLEEGEDALTFRQLWQGAPLFSQQVTLEFRGGSVIAMTGGRRLAGQPIEDNDRPVITVSTALFQLFNGINALGDVCSSIDDVAQGYVSTAALSGPGTLTPVWRVATDTGAYQLDLVAGTLSRVA